MTRARMLAKVWRTGFISTLSCKVRAVSDRAVSDRAVSDALQWRARENALQGLQGLEGRL